MSTEENNKALTQRYIDAISNTDVEAFRATLHDDVRHIVPGTSMLSAERNIDEVCELLGMITNFAEDGVKLTVHHIVAEGDLVFAEATGKSTVAGNPYENAYVFLIKVRGDKIALAKEYMDTKLVDDTFAPLVS